MASGRQEHELGIPQWKKDLLLRRRTQTRAITSGPGGVQLRVSCPAALRPESVPLVQSYGKHLPSRADFHPDTTVRTTMRFLDQDLSSSELIAIKCSTNSDSDLKPKMVEEKPDKKPSFRSMEKPKEDKHSKSLINNNLKADDEDYHSDSSEELQYGPGIVNKLKSKYLSMTLRDNQKYSSRPSLSNLRRATSLENMLDDDSNRLQQKPHFIKKPYHSSTYRSSKISQHHAKYLGLTRGSESMKRARSMDTLLKSDNKNSFNQMSASMPPSGGYSNGLISPSIINEDIIIVDNSPEPTEENKQPAKTEDGELPPHDLVKQTLKIFETTVNKKPSVEVKSKVKTAVNKISNNVRPNSIENLVSKTSKPSLSPKPVLSPEKRFSRPKVTSPKRVFPVVSSIEKPKPPVIAPRVCPIGEPKKFPSPKISPKVSPTVETKIITQTSPVRSNHVKNNIDEVPITSTPVSSQSVSEPVRLSLSPVNLEPAESETSPIEDKPKYISQKARDGISKEGMSMKFSFNDKPLLSEKSYLPRTVPQATNTALISSQVNNAEPQINTPVKQVAVIRPVVKNKILTEQEIEKNHINKVKSVESKIVKSDETSVSDNKPQLWEKKTWQSQNTMVFNFSDRKSVPDYIENDGLVLTNRKTTKCNGEEVDGGSGEEDWDPPLTCNIRFVGDNILINGKSSFKKEPRLSKLRIQFNDEATTTFEYPSEESLSEEVTSTPSPTQTPNPLTLGGGTLSNYTPSKSVAGEKFELGVTRTSPLNSNNHEPSSEAPATEKKEDEYLKPVDPDEVNPWSHDTTTDMLF